MSAVRSRDQYETYRSLYRCASLPSRSVRSVSSLDIGAVPAFAAAAACAQSPRIADAALESYPGSKKSFFSIAARVSGMLGRGIRHPFAADRPAARISSPLPSGVRSSIHLPSRAARRCPPATSAAYLPATSPAERIRSSAGLASGVPLVPAFCCCSILPLASVTARSIAAVRPWSAPSSTVSSPSAGVRTPSAAPYIARRCLNA